jgi:hypothetical protein
MRLLVFAIAMLLVPAVRAAEVQLVSKVTHPALGEISGLVASSYPGIYWTHNDSGDEARIFAIKADAEVVVPRIFDILFPDSSRDEWPGYRIDNAWQYDWEDIANANGVLYLTDVGNNDNARRDLGVYLVNEPNPLFVTKTRALNFLPVRYPDQQQYPAKQWHFDCEATFTVDGELYFLTKHRQPGKALQWEPGTKLYRLTTRHTDRDNVLKLVDRHPAVSLATAADVSPDGQHLAILSYARLWVFDKPRRGDKWLQSAARVLDFDRSQVKQNEAITWENNETLLMANEQRQIFRIELGALKQQPAR